MSFSRFALICLLLPLAGCVMAQQNEPGKLQAGETCPQEAMQAI